MAELKPGWKRVRFGDVVRLNKDTCKDPEAEGIERVIGLEHLEPGDLRIRSWGHVVDGTTFTNRVRPGQVLFGKRRAYQRKVAVVDFDAVCSGDIYVFESSDTDQLLHDLLPFICRSDTFFEHAIGTSAGSLSPRTNWRSLADYQLMLPPLEEQRAILGFLSSWRTSCESLANCIHAYNEMNSAYLHDLFDFDWPVRPIRDALQDSAFGPRFPGHLYANHQEANAWTVRTTDFAEGGIDFDGVPGASLDQHITDKHCLLDGDFLLSRSGEYAGMARVFRQPRSDPRRFIPAAFLIRFRLDEKILLPEFLEIYCQSPRGQARVRALASGSAQPNISGTAFSSLLVPCPPLSEQERLLQDFSKIVLTKRILRLRLAEACHGMKLAIGGFW